MSQSEIVSLSEFEATRPDLYRGSETREPTPQGVLDRRLGVTDKTSHCETCGCKTIECSGHMAFIRAESGVADSPTDPRRPRPARLPHRLLQADNHDPAGHLQGALSGNEDAD